MHYILFLRIYINGAKWYLFWKLLFSFNILLRSIHGDTDEFNCGVIYMNIAQFVHFLFGDQLDYF